MSHQPQPNGHRLGRRALARPPGGPARPTRPGSRRDSRRPGQVSQPPAASVRVADLFAGIGGFQLAFDRLGGRTVFASENDRHARTTYETNFTPSNPELFASGNFAGDITAVGAERIPDFDVLTAGFPCQPFSTAGKRRGFDDSRGTLFFHIARIIKAKRPTAFFIENVKGLRNHDAGRTLATIKRILTEELGYSFHSKIVRACDFGLPQLRPRLFMVGFRNPTAPFAFPDPIPLTMTMSDIFGGRAHRDIGYTIMVGGRGSAFGRRFCWDGYLVDGELRRLGVDEARRMQGFPDDFAFPVSVSQAMKQLGNSVAVPAVEAVARNLIRGLREYAQ